MLLCTNLFFKQRVNTITSAPSLIELVLNPFPSKRLKAPATQLVTIKNKALGKQVNKIVFIHCPMEHFVFLSENPKLIQRLIVSGSIPPPSSCTCKA